MDSIRKNVKGKTATLIFKHRLGGHIILCVSSSANISCFHTDLIQVVVAAVLQLLGRSLIREEGKGNDCIDLDWHIAKAMPLHPYAPPETRKSIFPLF